MTSAPGIQQRNSLGYAIGSPTDRSRSGHHYIVWGRRADGTRVFIGDASRGGVDQLRCECNSLLIARKGEIRAAHFAHKGDQKGLCDRAFLNALERFALSAIQNEGLLRLPGMLDEPVHQVTPLEPAAGVVRLRLKARVNVDVYLAHKSVAKEVWQDHQKSIDVSALIIDLRRNLNLADHDLRAGIVRHFKRSWLFNRKGAGDKSTGARPASLVSNNLSGAHPAPVNVERPARRTQPQPSEQELIANLRAELERDYGGRADRKK